MEEMTVTLSVDTLIRECAKNPHLEEEHKTFFRLKNRENIHSTFRYQKFNEDFIDQVTCYRKENDLVGQIRPSYDEFEEKIARYLNAEIAGKGEEEKTKQLLERVTLLENIQTEKELKENFPLIAKDLNDGRSYIRSLEKLRKQEKIGKDEYMRGEHYFYSCALKRGLKNFLKTQSIAYKRFIHQRHQYKEKVETTTYNAYIKKHFNLDKFYLYVMHEYLKKAETSKNRVEIKKYIELVERYFNSPYYKECEIEVEETKVRPIDLKIRIYNLREYLNSQKKMLDWIILPEGKDYKRVEGSKKEKVQKTKMTKDQVEKLRSIGEKKKAFYEEAPYIAKAIGLKKYHGYIAYIFANGEVILDREYSKTSPSTATGNAIYNMRIENFCLLSRNTKKSLMTDPRVLRLSHKAGWEEKIRKIIERPATQEEEEKTKALVKRLKKRNY